MSRKKISQVEAWSLHHQVKQLKRDQERMRNRWNQEWAEGWINIDSFLLSDAQFARLDTARRLGHAVVMVPSSRGNEVRLYADRLP